MTAISAVAQDKQVIASRSLSLSLSLPLAVTVSLSLSLSLSLSVSLSLSFSLTLLPSLLSSHLIRQFFHLRRHRITAQVPAPPPADLTSV